MKKELTELYGATIIKKDFTRLDNGKLNKGLKVSKKLRKEHLIFKDVWIAVQNSTIKSWRSKTYDVETSSVKL